MDLFEYANQNTSVQDTPLPKENVYTVSQVTSEIKSILKAAFSSKSPIDIQGEVANYRGRNSSGHMYFSIKDQGAIMPCVFFKYANAKCNTSFKDGDQVQLKGKVEVYEKGGRYQFIVERLKPKGQGALFEAFLRMKQKLAGEGLFDQGHKKKIPAFSKRIGVITSSTGAVIKDIIHVIKHRAPVVDIVLFPCKVQGDDAHLKLISHIKDAADPQYNLDVLIVGRGGGSMEDLWCFNHEDLARAIFGCPIPVVSAVGHQTDFTICDFVADVRAATPSQAAQWVVPDLIKLQEQSQQSVSNIYKTVMGYVQQKRMELTRWQSSPMMRDPRSKLNQHIQMLDDLHGRLIEKCKHVLPLKVQNHAFLKQRLVTRSEQQINHLRQRLKALSAKLEILSPKHVLARGYSIVRTKDKKIISQFSQLKIKDQLDVTLSDGAFECMVTDL